MGGLGCAPGGITSECAEKPRRVLVRVSERKETHAGTIPLLGGLPPTKGVNRNYEASGEARRAREATELGGGTLTPADPRRP